MIDPALQRAALEGDADAARELFRQLRRHNIEDHPLRRKLARVLIDAGDSVLMGDCTDFSPKGYVVTGVDGVFELLRMKPPYHLILPLDVPLVWSPGIDRLFALWIAERGLRFLEKERGLSYPKARAVRDVFRRAKEEPMKVFSITEPVYKSGVGPEFLRATVPTTMIEGAARICIIDALIHLPWKSRQLCLQHARQFEPALEQEHCEKYFAFLLGEGIE